MGSESFDPFLHRLEKDLEQTYFFLEQRDRAIYFFFRLAEVDLRKIGGGRSDQTGLNCRYNLLQTLPRATLITYSLP